MRCAAALGWRARWFSRARFSRWRAAEARRRESARARSSSDPRTSTARSGKKARRTSKAQLGLIEDSELVAYVAKVGARLARHAPRRNFEYSFQIVDQEAPNAFALPGGYIFVSRGLLTLTNSEDELANVLGHEIVHVAARHAAARQEVGTQPSREARLASGRLPRELRPRPGARGGSLGPGARGRRGLRPR